MFTFRPAVRENVGLLLGLIGPSGSGKTFTAMRLAKGMAGDTPFAVIDTEAGRAKHYADLFRFDHGDLRAPFRPSAYADAIQVADEARYPVIVVDSCSHEHAGEGGLLDWQEEELQRMAGDDYRKREAVKMASWIKPKMAHKAMVQRLLQVRAHLILCFRAEEKIEMVREDGKLIVRPKQSSTGSGGWIPVCEKTLPYELTASFLLTPDAPGVPKPIKLQAQHRPLFRLDAPIDEAAGRQLAAWARGGAQDRAPAPHGAAPNPAGVTPSEHGGGDSDGALPDRASILLAINAAIGRWPKVPPDPLWKALCRDVCRVEDIEGATIDVAALSDLLAVVDGYARKDPAARTRVNDLARTIQGLAA